MDNLTRQEAQERARLIRDVSYDIALDLTTGDERFLVDTTINFACTEPGSATFIEFKGPRVVSAELNDEAVDASGFDGMRLEIKGLASSNTLHVVAEGEYSNKGLGLNRFVDPVDGRVYMHSDFEPYDARRMFPCFDQPDIKAPFEFSVNAPAGFIVLSNYPVSERPADGAAGWWRFERSLPMSTYFACVTAGEYWSAYRKHRNLQLGWHCRQSLRQYMEPDLDELFEITGQGFDYFEEVFGIPYPFGPKYDQVAVPEFYTGAMENVGLVTFTERLVFRSRVTQSARRARAGTILHELSHMWFGDLVTMRWWDDLWLNESFATLLGNFATARATRFTTMMASFAHSTKQGARLADERPSTHPIVADIPDILAARINFDAITYSKGASVFRQLVAWVGEDDFFKGVHEYFRAHRYSNAELRDFLQPLESASGRDLSAWSQEWLETTGANTISVDFDEEDGRYTRFRVIQEAPPEHPTLRAHRLAIGLYDDVDGEISLRKRAEIDLTGEGADVAEFVGAKTADIVIPNDGDLTYAKLTLDARSIATTTAALHKVDDDMARALLWAASSEMLRDGNLGAREWLRLMLNNIDGETEMGVIQTLLLQAAAAATSYAHPSKRDEARQLLADAALEHVRAAERASDLQRTWAGVLIRSARSPEHLALLRNLLESEEEEFPGLQIDVGMRWQIVTTLCARGVMGEEDLERELERDPTDVGRRHVLTARTVRPDPAAKEEAWTRMTEDASIALADLRAIAGGFSQVDQAEILLPYADKYFDELDKIWAEREVQIATSFTGGLFPSVQLSDDVVRRAEDYLRDHNDAPPAVRKVLMDGAFEMRRTMRARERDLKSG